MLSSKSVQLILSELNPGFQRKEFVVMCIPSVVLMVHHKTYRPNKQNDFTLLQCRKNGKKKKKKRLSLESVSS